jgi:hypothetical protein
MIRYKEHASTYAFEIALRDEMVFEEAERSS